MQWDVDTISAVKFNQSETSVLASAGSDRTVSLYDLRSGKPISQVVMAVSILPLTRLDSRLTNVDFIDESQLTCMESRRAYDFARVFRRPQPLHL